MSKKKSISLPDGKKMEYTEAKAGEKQCDRLTVQLTVYHQRCGENPTSITPSFVAALEEVEQPYSRQLKVGTEWMLLDFGWLEGKQGEIIIENRAGKGLIVTPSKAQQELTKRQYLIIGIEDDKDSSNIVRAGIIRSGRPNFGEFFPGKKVYVKASEGTVSFNLNVMPR